MEPMAAMISASCVLALLLLAATTGAAGLRTSPGDHFQQERTESGSKRNITYFSKFGDVEWTTQPGGRYKESSTKDLPGANTAGILVELAPGGMREPHWHDPNEWAYVIKGTCRATLVDQGKARPIESWDFRQGDVWYFPSNLGHTVVGLAGDDNCTYIAGYDQGDFTETADGRGLSNWLSTVPADILAQALGVSEDDIAANIQAGTNNFLAQGDLEALTAGQDNPPVLAAQAASLQPPQVTTISHRLPLYDATTPEIKTAGGTIQIASAANLPSSKAIAGAIVRMLPGSLRQLHWHPKQSEWQFVINGTTEVGIYDGPGKQWNFTLNKNDIGFAPRGSGHWLRNTDPENDLWMVLIFDSGDFTDIELSNWAGSQPPQYAATSLNTSLSFTQSWDYTLAGLAPNASTLDRQAAAAE